MKKLLLLCGLLAVFACTEEPADSAGGNGGRKARVLGSPTSRLALRGSLSVKLSPDSYNYQYDTVPDRIYIKAPDIYVFEQGKSKSSMTPCSVGSIAYYDDAPWFSITAVTIDKLYTGVFDITISIKAFKDIVPVMTTLKIGDVVLDEVRSAPEKETVFENDSYISETFQFRYNRGALSDISDLVNEATFCTEDIFHRISGAQITAECNIPSVKVIIENSELSSK